MRPIALHRGPPDRRLRRTRLLQLPQVRIRKHRALAPQAGDAPRRFRPPRRRRRNCRPCRPRTRRRSRRVFPPRPERIAAEPRIPSSAKKSPASTKTPTLSPSSPPARSPRHALAAELQRLTGSDHLAFYDSISPSSMPHHRYGQGLLRRPLGQRHRRLHQLPLHQRRIRPLPEALTGRSRGRRKSQRRGKSSITSKAAFPSKRPPAAAATPSASAP